MNSHSEVAKLAERLWEESRSLSHPLAGDVRAIVDRITNALAQDRASHVPCQCGDCVRAFEAALDKKLADRASQAGAAGVPAGCPTMQPGYPGDAAIAKAFRVESTTAPLDTQVSFIHRVIDRARLLAAAPTPAAED